MSVFTRLSKRAKRIWAKQLQSESERFSNSNPIQMTVKCHLNWKTITKRHISSISTSAASVFQQHQHVSSISVSAASAHQQYQQNRHISSIRTSAAATAHQQHQHFSRISSIRKQYLPMYVNFTCFNTIWPISLSSPCWTQMLPLAKSLSYEQSHH